MLTFATNTTVLRAFRPLLASWLLWIVACASTLHRGTHAGHEVVTLRVHYNNTHAVVFERGIVLIDAGLAVDAARLDAALREAGLDPSRILAVVLTHGHADHAGGAAWFRARYGAAIYAGAGDRTLLAKGANDTLCPTDATARRRLARSQAARYSPLVADHWVTERIDLSDELGVPLQLVPLPGHTPGSLVALTDDAAFVGDLFRGEIVGKEAAVHFYMCELEGNHRDVRWLLTKGAPRASTFYTGHFGPLTREAVRRAFAR